MPLLLSTTAPSPDGTRAILQPAHTVTDPVHVRGKPAKRRMVVLRTNGCAYDRGKKGCTMCGFIEHAIPESLLRVNEAHLVHQLRAALAPVAADSDLAQVDLLTLGSFFHDVEVSPSARAALLDVVADIPSVLRIVVESRAPYVSLPVLTAARGRIGAHQRLELGLGVETSNHELRNSVLRKSLEWTDVGRVMRLCRDSGIDFLAYLLIKPPSLTEQEAIDDAVQSAIDLVDLAARIGVSIRLAFEPVFVARDSHLNAMFERGEYELCRLWSVVDVVQRCHGLAPIFVGLSDEGLSSGRFPRGCGDCDTTLRTALQAYNGSQDIRGLTALNCDCRTGIQ